jgi:hypothetical protein
MIDDTQMMRDIRVVAIFLLFLLPSAHYAWISRDLPGFGRLHEESRFCQAGKDIGFWFLVQIALPTSATPR